MNSHSHSQTPIAPVMNKMSAIAVLQKSGLAKGPDSIKINGNKIFLLTSGDRKAALQQALLAIKKLVPKTNPKIVPDRSSSIGVIGFDNSPIKIGIKDVSQQGDKSAGVANELELAQIINGVIAEHGYANVTFTDDRGKSISIKKATRVDVSGRSAGTQKTGGVQKADVVLSNASGNSLPISIKKVNAEAWESGEGSFGEKAKAIVTKLAKNGDIKLTKTIGSDGKPNYQLDKEIVIEPTEEEAMKAIFGTDLNPKGGIVIQTFQKEHFVQNGANVKVQCQAIIQTKEDIPESHLMVWLIRNGAGRWPNGYRGLRPMGVVLTRAIGKQGNKDVVLVDKNGKVLKR